MEKREEATTVAGRAFADQSAARPPKRSQKACRPAAPYAVDPDDRRRGGGYDGPSDTVAFAVDNGSVGAAIVRHENGDHRVIYAHSFSLTIPDAVRSSPTEAVRWIAYSLSDITANMLLERLENPSHFVLVHGIFPRDGLSWSDIVSAQVVAMLREKLRTANTAELFFDEVFFGIADPPEGKRDSNVLEQMMGELSHLGLDPSIKNYPEAAFAVGGAYLYALTSALENSSPSMAS